MIPIKTNREIKIMAEAGQRLAEIMEQLKKSVQPGIKTNELDRLAESLILKSKAKPAFKGYKKFPATLCTSVNEVIVHGVPSNYILKEGDIISLDLGLKYKGFFVDMAITVPVGKADPEVLRLIRVAKKALKRGIKKIRPGIRLGAVGNTIERYVKSQGFNVVRDLCGHGIGKDLHEEPQVLNYGKRREGPILKEGMVLCLEPMIVMGDWKIKKSKDGFGYKSADISLSADF
jgi:methionyl aminopeptidase